MNEYAKSIIGIFTAIVGVAIVAVIVSKNSNTGSVISAATGGFAQDLSVAVSPITGGGLSAGSLSGFTGSASSYSGILGGAGYNYI